MKNFLTILFSMVFLSTEVNAQLKNLGSNINSVYNEIRPVISLDGKTIYFTVEGEPQNKNKDGQSIWFSQKNGEDEWTKSLRFPEKFNSEKYNGVYWCSNDGNTLLIRGYYESDTSLVSRGFSFIKKEGESWSYPKGLEIENYPEMSRGIYAGATLSYDATVLITYFSEENDGEVNDLYISFYLDSTGKYSKPIKLSFCNDLEDEISPYISPDGNTIYFSSDKENGLGDYDIWYCTRLDDTWMNWTKPQNLGKPFNSKGWDAYFSIGGEGKVGFVSTYSKKTGYGGTDIVFDSLPNELRVDLKTLKKVEKERYENFHPDTLYIKDTVVMTKEIPCDPLDTLDNEQLVKELSKGKILFDFGSSVLRPDAYNKLEIVAKIMKLNPSFELELRGHTDAVGSDKRNLKWSQDRADNAKNFLVAKGIDPRRVKSIGSSKSEPVATNNTDEGRQLNRRVDVILIQK